MFRSPFRTLLALALTGVVALVPVAGAQADGGELDPQEFPRSTPATPRAPGGKAVPRDGTAPVDPQALATAEAQLQAADPGDLWRVADAVSIPIDGLWDAKRGAYITGGVPRARLNAEMLLLHSYAAVQQHAGSAAHPERIEPLVRMMTGPGVYLPTLNGLNVPPPSGTHSVTAHAPGFVDPAGTVGSMHQALDAVIMRALAAAWQARDAVGLSAETRALIVDRVNAVAYGAFWRYPSRLLNQIAWNADVYAAHAAVTGNPILMQQDYRRQLIWFADHAHRTAYPGGTSNLASGLGFHYLPNRPPSSQTNRTDTSEYANITLGALAYYDAARAAGMAALPKRVSALYRSWTRRIAYGNWTAAGYLNWDTGKSVQRLHLTQYWLLALRGFAAGVSGSAKSGFLGAADPTVRGVVRAAVQHYQQRAAMNDSVVLPPSAYGFQGSALVTPTFDGMTGTARFASSLAELAARGLSSTRAEAQAGKRVRPLPNAYAHDADLGRLAITTTHYATAFLRPWTPLRVGGLEPSRLFDGRGRALTGVGGSLDGALGLRISTGKETLIETQPGRPRKYQTDIEVPKSVKDASHQLPRSLTVRGSDRSTGVTLKLKHVITRGGIRTDYTVKNDRTRSVLAELRIPTYAEGPIDRGSLRVGQTYSASHLRRTLKITAPSGGRFDVRLSGLPSGASGKVIRVKAQKGNPAPGPQLRVQVKLPPKKTTILTRTLSVPLVQ